VGTTREEPRHFFISEVLLKVKLIGMPFFFWEKKLNYEKLQSEKILTSKEKLKIFTNEFFSG
jgi:hypothetical protein